MCEPKSIIPIAEVRNRPYRFKNLFYNRLSRPENTDFPTNEFFQFQDNKFISIPWKYDSEIGYFAELRDEVTDSIIKLPYTEWEYNYERNFSLNYSNLSKNSAYINLELLKNCDRIINTQHVMRRIKDIFNFFTMLMQSFPGLPEDKYMEDMTSTLEDLYRCARKFVREYGFEYPPP